MAFDHDEEAEQYLGKAHQRFGNGQPEYATAAAMIAQTHALLALKERLDLTIHSDDGAIGMWLMGRSDT